MAQFLTDNAYRALSTFSGNNQSHYITESLRILKTMQPTGKLHNLQLRIHNGDVFISGEFSELALQRWQGIPALNSISGDFQGNEKNGILNTNTTNSQLHFKNVLQAPINLRELVGLVKWTVLPNRIELLSDSIIARTDYVPTAIMGDELLTWYRALENGQIKHGIVVVYGFLDEFPFLTDLTLFILVKAKKAQSSCV